MQNIEFKGKGLRLALCALVLVGLIIFMGRNNYDAKYKYRDVVASASTNSKDVVPAPEEEVLVDNRDIPNPIDKIDNDDDDEDDELFNGQLDPEGVGLPSSSSQSASVLVPDIPSIDSNYEDYIGKQEMIRNRFIDKRNKILIHGRNISSINLWTNHIDIASSAWNYFPPTFVCPHLLERVGTPGDGGKWLCGLELFERGSKLKDCVVYSFGVSTDSSFEMEVLQRTDCIVYAFDPTVSEMRLGNLDPSLKSRVHFSKTGLSGDENDKNGFKTLGQFMQENGHDYIDFLKIDVEGAEYAAFQQMFAEFPDTLPVGHLNVELHLDKKYWKEVSFVRFYEMMESLEEQGGLRIFSWEQNLYECMHGGMPGFIEYSLINIVNKRNRLLFQEATI